MKLPVLARPIDRSQSTSMFAATGGTIQPAGEGRGDPVHICMCPNGTTVECAEGIGCHWDSTKSCCECDS